LNLYRNNFTGNQEGVVYTPFSTQGNIAYPGLLGGINVPGCAADPTKGRLVCPFKSMPYMLKFFPQGNSIPDWATYCLPQVDTPYFYCRAYFRNKEDIPCTLPPFLSLAMIDLNTPSILWNITYGYTPALGNPEWGSRDFGGGVIITGGGLVFGAGTDDNHLWIFNADDGTTEFSIELPQRAGSTPITYRVKDRQYVVINTGNGVRSAVYAFAIPEENYDYYEYYAGFLIIILMSVIFYVYFK